ncbi:hypothetical protein GCM10028775_46880 [Catellatospora paridis]
MDSSRLPIEEVRSTYESLRPTYRRYADMLRSLTRQVCESHGVSVESIEARAKEVNSLCAKWGRHAEYRELEDVTDLCGVRIITLYANDVERARDMLRTEFDVLEEKSRGSEIPEAFGYRSLHMLVRVSTVRCTLSEWKDFGGLVAEFQLRTVLQHAWAVISHRLDYKTSEEVPAKSRRKLFRVAALLETGDELFADFRDEVSNVREEYQKVATAEAWRDLALDLDSVIAAWNRLPLDIVKQTALSAGFSEGTQHIGEAPMRRAIGNLVTVAAHAGIGTVGSLADYMSRAAQYFSALERFASEATTRGFRPVADTPDVLTICLVLDDSRLRVIGALPFRPEIEKALDVVQRELQNSASVAAHGQQGYSTANQHARSYGTGASHD